MMFTMNLPAILLVAACAASIPVMLTQSSPSAEAVEENRKMDSRLAALYDSASSGNARAASHQSVPQSLDGQTVQVILVMAGPDAALPQDLGIVVETTYGNMVQATVPVMSLVEIASNDSIKAVKMPARPVALDHDKRGHVISEGAGTMMSGAMNAAGYTGKNVKVAVLDIGFNVTNTEIAGNIVEHRSFVAGGENPGDITADGDTAHGTGVSEIIVDIAPDVQLFLYNFGTIPEFFNLIDYLIQRGDIDIVSMSLGWYNDVGPRDGSNSPAAKVSEAAAAGILWVNSAGNEAQQHWQGRFSDPDGDNWHNFSGDDETLRIELVEGEPAGVVISWDDWASPSQDYDLYMVNGSGATIAKSENRQPDFEPFEVVEHTPAADGAVDIRIKKHSATRDVMFHLFSLPPYNLAEYRVAASSLSIPADAKGALAVGANHWRTGELEPYSSQGPTLDGRIKPDLTAPARVSTTAYGEHGFAGTSASAPHAAGAAALVMQKYPDATAAQVQKLLESTVQSRHAKSSQDGTGRVDVRMFANSDILALENSDNACASENACFYPKTLRISRGDTVTWTNTENSPITITGGTGADRFNSGQVLRGNTYSHTFTSDGTFSYSDGLHSWARGSIIVGASADTTPPAFAAASYDKNTGMLRITFTESIDRSNTDLSRFDIREAGYSTGGVSLSGSAIQTSDAATLAITLNESKKDMVNSMAAPQLDIGAGAVRDLSGNVIVAMPDRPITVSGNNDGDLRAMIGELRATVNALAAKINSMEAAVSNLTARVAALESGGGTPPPAPMTGVKGKVYTDSNGNGMLDAGEPGVPGRTVLTVSLANHADVTRTATDSNGDYSVGLAAGGYLVQIEGGGPRGYAYIDIPEDTMYVLNLIP